VELQLGIFEHCANLDRELLAALATLLEAVAKGAFGALLARLTANAGSGLVEGGRPQAM
jgi:hypothetical protein